MPATMPAVTVAMTSAAAAAPTSAMIPVAAAVAVAILVPAAAMTPTQAGEVSEMEERRRTQRAAALHCGCRVRRRAISRERRRRAEHNRGGSKRCQFARSKSFFHKNSSSWSCDRSH